MRRSYATIGAIFGVLIIGLFIGGIWVDQSKNEKVAHEMKQEEVATSLEFDVDTIQIELSQGYDGFEGWGTSLAWWGHIVGQWKDGSKYNEVMDLVFDSEKGLGFNIVRYNIGGGENPGIPSTLRPGGDVPGFQPEEGVWDWEADPGQRRVLLDALERGADIAEAFSNSPPYWMTISGSVTGAEGGGNNLKDEYYDAFADYLTEVVRNYKERYGITFRTLNPLNEPSSNWWVLGNKQEGAHFSLEKQMEIIKKTAASLGSKGLSAVSISAPDGNSIDETVEALKVYDDDTLRVVSQVNTHSYHGMQLVELRELTDRAGKKLWMSEFGAGGTEPHNHDDLSSVMELAERVIFDLRLLQPAAWVYWQAVEDEGARNNWGFIHSDFSVDGHYEMTKQYYGMAQFSKFIRPGSRILFTSSGHSVAAYDADSKQLSIVLRNKGSNKTHSFDLSAFQYSARSAEIYVTSMLKNMDAGQVQLYDNGFMIEAEPESITTIVISDIKIHQ